MHKFKGLTFVRFLFYSSEFWHMEKNSSKKIWFLSICGICFLLTGCFHVPDEDWIFTKDSPTKNKDTSYEESQFINSVNTLINGVQNDEINKNSDKQDVQWIESEKYSEISDTPVEQAVENISGEIDNKNLTEQISSS